MAYPLFNVITLSADEESFGAQSALIPCSAEDAFVLTASFQYLSGGMQPRVSVEFWDAALSTFYGRIALPCVLTDNGWHVGTAFGSVPPGAQAALVTTDCEYN